MDITMLLALNSMLKGGGGSGGGDLSLIDRANIDGASYASSGRLDEIPPVICIFDNDHTGTTAFTTNPTIVGLVGFGMPEDDKAMPLSAEVFIKGEVPGKPAIYFPEIMYSTGYDASLLNIVFNIGEYKYSVQHQLSIIISPETETPEFTVIESSYTRERSDGSEAPELITETEFYENIDRIIVYLSSSNSEFILPLNTTFEFPAMAAILPPESDPEMMYQELAWEAAYLVSKILDTASADIYTAILLDNGDNICFISVEPNGSIKRLDFIDWEDPDGNTRYFKFSTVSSAQIVYKWSEIKDDVQTFIMAIGENLQNGVVPSIFQDDPSFSGLQAGLYTFSVSSDGPAFNCMFFEYSSVTMATILIADADGDNPSFEIHYARFDANIDPE